MPIPIRFVFFSSSDVGLITYKPGQFKGRGNEGELLGRTNQIVRSKFRSVFVRFTSVYMLNF
jgi:hypothetical protein